MSELFLIIFTIFLLTFTLSFIQKRIKDRCLKDFLDNPIWIVFENNKSLHGKIQLENSGIEINFLDKNLLKNKSIQEEKIQGELLYKSEFNSIKYFLRFHDELCEKAKKQRLKEIENLYKKSFSKTIKRKCINLIKTMRDAFLSIFSLFIGHLGTGSSIGKVIKNQSKKTHQVGDELFKFVGTAFEPLLEKQIGNLVFIEAFDTNHLYKGILKEYTSDFIEILDINYLEEKTDQLRKADLIISRSKASIRYLC